MESTLVIAVESIRAGGCEERTGEEHGWCPTAQVTSEKRLYSIMSRMIGWIGRRVGG